MPPTIWPKLPTGMIHDGRTIDGTEGGMDWAAIGSERWKGRAGWAWSLIGFESMPKWGGARRGNACAIRLLTHLTRLNEQK